jgi:preprotein translocase subunit SecD
MKKLLFVLAILSIFSCNKAKESAQDSITRAMEKAIENQTGTQVVLPDAEDIDKNAGYVTYKSETKVYLTGKEHMQASAVFQKDNDGLSIGFTLSGEKGNSMIAIINHVPEDFSLPLTGKFALSNRYDGKTPVATIMYMNVTENGMMSSEVPYEGEMTITKLTKNQINFEINGKGGDPTDAESPSNWKTITGKGKLEYPIIQSFGIDKNNVLK